MLKGEHQGYCWLRVAECVLPENTLVRQCAWEVLRFFSYFQIFGLGKGAKTRDLITDAAQGTA